MHKRLEELNTQFSFLTRQCSLLRSSQFLLSYFFSAVFWGIPLSMVGSVFTNMNEMEEGNDTTDPGTPIGLTIIVLGVGATVGVTLAITHYTRKKLREIIKEEERKAKVAEGGGCGGGAKVTDFASISEVGVELMGCDVIGKRRRIK